MHRVLVIKLGALGDFVLAFGPFAAIRAHHRASRITLLTTAPFAETARASPWFDEVVIDCRPSWWQVPHILWLASRLRGFDLVYDLQTSRRSTRYFWLAGRPPWSGIAADRRLRHANPGRDRMHTLERQRDQLAAAGIACFPRPALGWLASPVPLAPALLARAALLVPGAAAHRPEKRWPVVRFAALATALAGRGLLPVVLGSESEAPLAQTIRAACPEAVDLTGKTGIGTIAALARGARLAVGNDTGPMHVAAAVGCRCVVLFSAASDPALTAPRRPDGSWPVVLREPDLSDLTVERVAATLG